MINTIKAFHGTGRVDFIIEHNGLLANLNSRKDDGESWKRWCGKYEEIVRETASVVRNALREGYVLGKDISHIKLDSPDEVLTDLAADRPTGFQFDRTPDARGYSELKRNLFIYLADSYQKAVSYTCPSRRKQPFPAVLEFDLPKEIIRPDVYPVEQAITYLVLGGVGLEHLSKVYVEEKNIRRVVKLLDGQGLEEIPAGVLR